MTTKDERATRKRKGKSPPREVVVARLRPELVRQLDAMAESMRPETSTSKLVELAVQEFLERNPSQK